MVTDLLKLPRDAFPLRTITTGATASNILGLGKPDPIIESPKARSIMFSHATVSTQRAVATSLYARLWELNIP